MKKSLNIKILETHIKLSLEDKDFYNYLKSVFNDYIFSENPDADIVSEFKWHNEFFKKTPLSLDRDRYSEYAGPSVVLGKRNERVQFLKKIHKRRIKIDFSLSEKQMHQGLFCYRKTLRNLWRAIDKKGNILDFFELSYFLFYYPLFWFLERHSAIHPMHASCVDTPKGGIILTGFPGSGKSVTSLALWSKSPEHKLLSDNIVLYGKEKVYACPEPIRLHSEGKRLIKSGFLEDISANGRLAKMFYSIKREYCREVSRPALFLFVKFSDSYSLKEIGRDEASNIALCQNLQGAEMVNYFEYASLLNLLDIDKYIFEERTKDLKSLFGDLKCFMLTVSRKEPIEATADKILGLL